MVGVFVLQICNKLDESELPMTWVRYRDSHYAA